MGPPPSSPFSPLILSTTKGRLFGYKIKWRSRSILTWSISSIFPIHLIQKAFKLNWGRPTLRCANSSHLENLTLKTKVTGFSIWWKALTNQGRQGDDWHTIFPRSETVNLFHVDRPFLNQEYETHLQPAIHEIGKRFSSITYIGCTYSHRMTDDVLQRCLYRRSCV